MQWVSGWLPFRPSLGSSPRPRDAVSVPTGTGSVWAAGFQASEIHQAFDGRGNRLALIGSCLPSSSELDAALLGLGAERWGDVAVWPGSYVAVGFDGQRTSVSGDLCGRQRVYFVETPEGVLWANAATPLAAYIGATVRLESLAIGLSVSGDAYAGETPFDGIRVVAPGSLLCVQGDRWSIQRWYRPRQGTSFDETVDRLRTLLPDAVDRRSQAAGRRLTFDFSGGIDSGTLVTLGARHRRAVGITYTDPWVANDDLEYAERIANAVPRIDHHIVRGGRADLFFTMLNVPESLPLTDLPSMSSTRLNVRAAVLRAAADVGSQIHVGGGAGDLVLHAESIALAGLYRAGRRREAVRRVAASARLRGAAPLGRVRAMIRLAHSTQADEIRRAATAISQRRYPTRLTASTQAMRGTFLKMGIGWLMPETADWVATQLLGVADHTAREDLSPEELRNWELVRDLGREHAATDECARALGITAHLPFTDNAILGTCLSLPAWQRRGNGTFKPLITVGLTDLLPDALTTRTTKGAFDYSYQEGLRRNATALRHILDESVLIAEGIVNGQAARDALRRMTQGLELGDTSLDLFLARETWLAALDTTRSKWWKEDAQ